jgi:hypothetical protein
MRIESSSGESVGSVCLFLTESEASELRDSLDGMLAERAGGVLMRPGCGGGFDVSRV